MCVCVYTHLSMGAGEMVLKIDKFLAVFNNYDLDK